MHQASQTAGAYQLGPGIITEKLEESKAFYTQQLGFKVRYEADWVVILYLEGQGEFELGFLKLHQASQADVFQKPFTGQRIWLVIEVDDVDAEYRRIQSVAIPIYQAIRTEPWGERHFVILDPNGIAIDVVTYTPPA